MQMTKSGRTIEPIVRSDRVFFRRRFFRTSGRNFTALLAGRRSPRRPRRRSRLLLVPSARTSSLRTPLSRWTSRCARAAAFGSCVTMTIVLPNSLLSRSRRTRISSPALRVEVARRLVGHEERRVGRDGARDGDALLLPARELPRVVVHPVGEADDRRGPSRPASAARARERSRQEERQLDVLEGRQDRDEVVELEDEADVLAPPLREGPLAHRGDLRPRRRGSGRRSGGRCRRSRFRSVVFPEPDGPIRATKSPFVDLERQAVEDGQDLRVARCTA